MVIPRPIEGRYRTLKDYAKWPLLTLLAVLPFVRVAGRPLLLLDIPARKFHVFGLTIWPQELYFLHVLILGAGVLLFFVTALLGRIWCGYACPQTIFTELYDHVARWIAGKRYTNRSLGKGGWAAIYAAWIILSLILGFIYVSYFVPYEQLTQILATLDLFDDGVPRSSLVALVGLAVFSFVNAAYFRENVCRLVCPYGRFQMALLDSQSPIVSYNVPRGEPRKAAGQKVGQHKGDCIDCKLCVLVCPTGIDIREGLQVGCLACGLCADACTQVLGKLGKETLIDYRTMEQAEDPTAARRYIRPRTLVYGSLLLGICILFGVLLVTRVPMYASVLRDRAIQNIHVPGVGYQNGYELQIANLSHANRRVRIRVAPEESVPSRFEIVASATEHRLGPEAFERLRLIVRYPEGSAPARYIPIRFEIQDLDEPATRRIVESVFSFPG